LQAVVARNGDNHIVTRRTVSSDEGASVVDGLTDADVAYGASVIEQATKPDDVPLNLVAMLANSFSWLRVRSSRGVWDYCLHSVIPTRLIKVNVLTT
jgi:hypothetical protein